MSHAGVLALCAESCSWLKAAFGCIQLDLHKTDIVFVSEESRRESDLDSLTENLMLMMSPFIVGLYELKTTNSACQVCRHTLLPCYFLVRHTSICYAVTSKVKPSGVCVGRV